MASRKANLVLLCEDSQHEAFARRFLQADGWHPRRIRVEKAPRGSGEAWVRQRYPVELRARRAGPATALAVVIDGDGRTVAQRLQQLDASCRAGDVAPRDSDEPVAIFVPCRNIETWIAYLSGNEVEEFPQYPRLARERDCLPAVRSLKAMCDAGALRQPTPPSIQASCTEYAHIATFPR